MYVYRYNSEVVKVKVVTFKGLFFTELRNVRREGVLL